MDKLEKLFTEVLEEAFQELTEVGNTILFEDQEFETIAVIPKEKGKWTQFKDVITKFPDGRLFLWEYEESLTDTQEDLGPAEYGEPQFIEVEEVQEVIIKKHYLPVRKEDK